MSLSKISTETDAPIRVRITSYNINRSADAEKLPETSWSTRDKRVIALVKKCDPDILCMQECRKLSDSDARELMQSFPEYNFFTFYANPSDMSLAIIIAYKQSRFYCVGTGPGGCLIPRPSVRTLGETDGEGCFATCT